MRTLRLWYRLSLIVSGVAILGWGIFYILTGFIPQTSQTIVLGSKVVILPILIPQYLDFLAGPLLVGIGILTGYLFGLFDKSKKLISPALAAATVFAPFMGFLTAASAFYKTGLTYVTLLSIPFSIFWFVAMFIILVSVEAFVDFMMSRTSEIAIRIVDISWVPKVINWLSGK